MSTYLGEKGAGSGEEEQWRMEPGVREKVLWRNAQKVLAYTAVGQMRFSL